MGSRRGTCTGRRRSLSQVYPIPPHCPHSGTPDGACKGAVELDETELVLETLVVELPDWAIKSEWRMGVQDTEGEEESSPA
ncbi:hypothetical protein NM688_g5812 [Phlebia brevispora]|uniref:Uncharacterized protein n=1 Tax=Phlebia brevispora TaxID=194682 RepID=A0ACC1SPG7_9APHY|nr:hypothetical protein NM688_g5812 [Phlebia brevispora]